MYLARGEAARAEALFRQALEVRRKAFGEDDWRVGVTKSLLGAALTPLGRFDEAEKLLLDAQRVLKHVPGPEGREAKANVVRLKALHDAWARPVGTAQTRTR